MSDLKEYNKLYYQTHREKIIDKSKKRRDDIYSIEHHRERLKQIQREYYWNNREEILKKAKDKRDEAKLSNS